MTIAIAYELVTKNYGRVVANQLVDNGYAVELKSLDKFPIADSMNPFFAGLSDKYEFAVVVIDEQSESSRWISKELSLQKLQMGNFTNIYPAFIDSFNISKWWSGHGSQIIIVGKSLPDFESQQYESQ